MCHLRYLWNTNLGVNMAAGAENGDGPQLSELESLQLKANKITDESLESTRRMINLCEEVRLKSFWMAKEDILVMLLLI